MQIIMSNERNELYDLCALRAQDVDLNTVVHRLAKINRFNGATRYPYSVAQHSVLVASLVSPALRLHALLHDAAEAFIVDLPRPVKQQCGDYRHIENLIEDQLVALGYPDARLHPEIKIADHQAFLLEREFLRGGAPVPLRHYRYLTEQTWQQAAERLYFQVRALGW